MSAYVHTTIKGERKEKDIEDDIGMSYGYSLSIDFWIEPVASFLFIEL